MTEMILSDPSAAAAVDQALVAFVYREARLADEARRKQLVWAIERKLAGDGARPIIFYSRGGTCWQPYVKGLTIMVNSIFNGNRREDIWLDK